MSSMDDHDYPETLSYNMNEDPSWGYKDFPTTHKALPCPSTTHKLYPSLPHPTYGIHVYLYGMLFICCRYVKS